LSLGRLTLRQHCLFVSPIALLRIYSQLKKPVSSEQFDYEGELAVIIGKSAHQVSESEALDYVAGYSCFMDATVRDMQFTWFTAGKIGRQRVALAHG
jgi:2-keto-4-pentenoate hydratase/2-oxohepta-3-ene-1,7-dioic acid hydratase (catechol pathway)